MSLGYLTPDPRLRELTDLGLIAAGAKLYTYVSGTPSTPLQAWTDSALTIAHTNPIVASAGGLFPAIYLTPGVAYRLVLTDALGNPLWGPVDPVTVPAAVAGVPASPNDATKFLNGATVPAFAAVKESDLAFTDVVTSDVSITKHGFAPKAPNDATKFLNGVGAYSVPGVLTLLKRGSGTSVAAGATTVDSIAITGLTAADLLIIEYEVESAVQLTNIPYLYNVTDALALATLDAQQNIGAGGVSIGRCVIRQRISGPTAVNSAAAAIHTTTAQADVVNSVFTTNWTGNWTLGLRHGGVVAGGTFSYQWNVYKLAGQ